VLGIDSVSCPKKESLISRHQKGDKNVNRKWKNMITTKVQLGNPKGGK